MASTQNSIPLAAAALIALGGCTDTSTETQSDQQETASVSQVTSVTDVSVADAQALLETSNPPVVLDVRTPEEFAEGHIPGAINVDLRGDNFAEELAKLDHSETYLLHCRSGSRSAQALEVMEQQQFENIAHMTEGFDGWTAAGLPDQQ